MQCHEDGSQALEEDLAMKSWQKGYLAFKKIIYQWKEQQFEDTKML